jgi:hypothetical protein
MRVESGERTGQLSAIEINATEHVHVTECAQERLTSDKASSRGGWREKVDVAGWR